MDPDRALELLRRRVAEYDELTAGDEDNERAIQSDLIDLAHEFAGLFAGLDEWLSRGGSRPRAWTYIHLLGDKYLPSPEPSA